MNKTLITSLVVFVLVGLVFSGCGKKTKITQSTDDNLNNDIQMQEIDNEDTTKKQEGELKIEDLKVGDGTETKVGDTISVNYVGTLTDGTKFDSSYDRNQPFEFTLGTNQVIKGWDIGVIGMRVGGIRKLTIPPDLAYGSRAVGAIPANSTLIFEIELLEIK